MGFLQTFNMNIQADYNYSPIPYLIIIILNYFLVWKAAKYYLNPNQVLLKC